MSARVLQINFKFSVSPSEYEQAVSPLADDVAAVPGCIWKVWILNKEEHEAGGIYLFDNKASVKTYLEGPIVAQVASHPALSEFSIKQFDVMEGVTAITRGPVKQHIQA